MLGDVTAGAFSRIHCSEQWKSTIFSPGVIESLGLLTQNALVKSMFQQIVLIFVTTRVSTQQ
ncbi:Uncharacterised protein [Yersinia nurmii]|uniref:Uncharacterized protein n=1 Tax=Yersinia nurmii TaxID=685706 RepID=A0ABM9SKS9_9GAMM|nr:Uncharacterised protein [Yersinia nurmii]